MTHFGFIKSRAVSLFSRTASRERRLENTRKSLARKILDRFVLEKMEDRWLPAISVTQSGAAVTITLDAANDQVLLQRTGGVGLDNFNITATSAITGSTSITGANSITVLDQGTNSGQQVSFLQSSVGNFVSSINSSSVERINISTRLDGSLTVTGSASEIIGSVASSRVATVVVNDSSLTVTAPQVSISTLTATNSTLTLTSAFQSGTSVTANNSCTSISGTIAPDFSQTSITVNGGTFTAIQDAKVNSVVFNSGTSAPTANFANASNATSITLNAGTLNLEGNVQTLSQTGGTMTVLRSPGTLVGVVDNPKITTLNISGGTATIQDDTVVSGVTTISGAGTIVTIKAGTNYSPTIGQTTISNGTVSISNTTGTGVISVTGGTVSLTDVTLNNSALDLAGSTGGTVSVLRGTYNAGISAAAGMLSVNSATISNANASPISPAISLSGANAAVFGSTITAKANTNAIEVSGPGSASINFGNATTAGNNTISILPGGNPYFIKNTSLSTVNAVGNTMNYNGSALPNSNIAQAFAIQNYIQGAGTSTTTPYGAVYFNAGTLYVLNNQSGVGINSIGRAADGSASGDTIYIEGGASPYIDSTTVIGKSLNFTGVANGTGTFPVLQMDSSTVLTIPFFRFFEDFTQSSPPAVQNVLSNLTFSAAGLSTPEANAAILVDGQYLVPASIVTLSGTTTSTGFDTTANPSLISMAGGELIISTSSTFVGSINLNPTIDSVFNLNAGTTVNGPLTIATPPLGTTLVANIAGTLNGPAAGILNLQGGTINVTGTITGSPVEIFGATFNLTGGTVTSSISLAYGALNITNAQVSGTVSVSGGTATISGSTLTADTAANPAAVNAIVTQTGGVLSIANTTVLANSSGSTYRDGVRVDGSYAGFIGSTLNLVDSCITLDSSNNNGTAGVRTNGVSSYAYFAPNMTLNLGNGTRIDNGAFSLELGGYNVELVNNQIDNISMFNPTTAFIKLADHAYFDDLTTTVRQIDASRARFSPFGAITGGFRPADQQFSPSDTLLQNLFTLESKIIDFTAGGELGYVYLYPDVNFAINTRKIQPFIDVVNLPNEQIYVQDGTYVESLTVSPGKTGLQLIGPTSYGNVTPATIAPPTGSIAAILVQSDNVQVSGFTLSGANGTTDLLSNGTVSGTNYGVTNYNGTASTQIANLTVTNSVLDKFINAGVYLKDNLGSAASTVSDSTISNVGTYGYNGGVVLSNSFAAVSNNTMTKVTNGVVLRDVTGILSGSAQIGLNTIDAYATGMTVSNYSSSSTFTIGSGSNFNSISPASNMNSTIPGPLSNQTIGIYLQGITGSGSPVILDNSITLMSYGYVVTNVAPSLTISGGSVVNAFSGVYVTKNQLFDPNVSPAPGLGSSNSDVTVSGVSVSVINSGIGFWVIGNTTSSAPRLTLNGGTSFSSGSSTGTTGAQASSWGILTLNNAGIFSTAGTGLHGVFNSNSTVVINSPASVSGYTSGNYGVYQSGSASVTNITGGSISGPGEQFYAIAGSLNMTGGTIASSANVAISLFGTTTASISSSSLNTSITTTPSSFPAIIANSTSLSISAGPGETNITSPSGEFGVINHLSGSLSISGGLIQSTAANGTVVRSRVSATNLQISGGTLIGSSGTNNGVWVQTGNATISGGSIVTNFTTGLRFESSGSLSISGGSITGNACGVSVSSSNANISGGRITSPQTGLSFSSPGTLNVLAGSTSDITGTNAEAILLTNGTSNFNGGTVSGSAIGINFNGAAANGTIAGVTFVGGVSDLQLNQTGGGIVIGGNNSFSGSAATAGNGIGYILNNTTQSFVIPGTNSFSGLTLSSLAVPANLPDLYSIQNRITDGLDNLAFGLVQLKPNTLLMTTNSFYSPATAVATVQRGIDLSVSGDTLWVDSGAYHGGIDTTGKTLTLAAGNESSGGVLNVNGNLTLSSTTTLAVRVLGNTTGSYTQINMIDTTVPVNFANAIVSYSNTGFTPTIGDQFKVINQIPSNTTAPTSTFRATVVGANAPSVLADQGRYELAPNQYFATLYQGITGTNRNDFVLVSVPQYVTNVVVYSNWNGSYFGDPVNYVNPSGVTEQLTYGLTAAANISTGLSYLQPSGGNSTISIANATYAEQLGGFAGNLSINIIGANSVTNTALGNVNGNITVDSISLSANNTMNFRVNAGVGVTTGDQINTSGLISVGNAIANISLNGNFSNSGLNTGNFLSLINNTNGTSSNPIVGSFRNSNGSTLLAGQYFSVTGQTDKGFYATYKLGTASPYNDFALIYNYALGKVPNVVVNQTWSNPDQLDFGAFVTVGNTSYTIGIDAFGEMAAYTPTGGAPLAGAAVAAAPNGAVSIAAGTYNSTFTVDKGFTLTGPTNGTASFPASSGQTVLTANGSNAANITATSWTNNLLFGNLLVTSGTIFDNAARLIDDGGSLYFQGGTTFSNVSLSTNRSILIGSNVAGNPATLQSPSGGTAITVSGTGKTATLTDIRLNGSGTGVNLTNTGAVTFNNVTGTSSLASIGSISGTTSLTMNYASSSDNNTLTVRSGSLSFTPLGTSNLNITGQSGLTFNASIGTTAGSAGNNTIVLAANSTMAGGVIATGSGVDVFTISAPQPLTVNSGAGNDTLSIAAANAFLSTYNGEAGVNTFRSGPNSVNYIDLAAGRSGSAFINRGNTTTRSSFSNIDKVYGNGFTDIFSVTDANTTFSLVNGGNGNDQLNFNGTSGANTSFNVTQALLANISGSSAGSVSYYNFANSTAQLSIIDSFVSIENLRGGTGDDTFVMSQGGSLSGSLNGGSGNNTLDYSRFLSSSTSSTSPGVRVDLTNGMGTGIGGTSAGRVSNIRDAYGTVGFDFLTGDAGNNILDGGEGNDSILGMAGNDILIGGLGSDTIRGAQGDNLSISGYVNFDTGGTTSAYGIPSQYKPFVLRSMMNQWATGNQTDAQFDNTANSLSTTGVQVLVPGNTTYNNIALFTANSTSDPIKGTVFDDGSADTLDMQFSSYNWIFIPTAGEIVVNGTPRKVTYIYKLIP